MQRIPCQPRPDLQNKLETVGFTFHQMDQAHPYWPETAYYEFTSNQVDLIEEATNQLQQLYVQATEAIIAHQWWDRCHIPAWQSRMIEASWARCDFSLYGRFDLAYDGVHPPKMLEYNADTPTSLLEAAVVQWYWLEETHPDLDQFNSLHERLVATWKYLKAKEVYFANLPSEEDDANTLYLLDTCLQADKRVWRIPLPAIGWNDRTNEFRDELERPIRALFKLYPWEWALRDHFGKHISGSSCQFIEPAWKSLWSNKAMLPILWELFPDHPNLLPAYFSPGPLADAVRKPFLSREGCNVTIFERGAITDQLEGPYGNEPTVDQAYFRLPCLDGFYPILGSWIVGGEAAGMGIRESSGRITNNTSRFMPHVFRPGS